MTDNITSVTELLLRIKVIEKILINNKITTQEDLDKELKLTFDLIIKDILKKANVQGDLDEIIQSLHAAHGT